MLARSPGIDPEVGIGAIASPVWFLLVLLRKKLMSNGYSHECICE